MKTPPLCKCQKCGNACLWISTLCSSCIREIEEQQKAEEAAMQTPELFSGVKVVVDEYMPPDTVFLGRAIRIERVRRAFASQFEPGLCKHCHQPVDKGDAHVCCAMVAYVGRGKTAHPEIENTNSQPAP